MAGTSALPDAGDNADGSLPRPDADASPPDAALEECAVGSRRESGAACIDVDECLEGSDDCSPLADCVNTAPGFDCACPQFYEGDGHGASGCQDTDECASATCGQVCIEAVGGPATCACNANFTLAPNDSDCLPTVGTAMVLHAPSGDDAAPEIAMNASGDAFAIWARSTDIWIRRYSPATGGWQPAVALESGATPSASPQVAINGDGDGVAIWVQNGTDVWTARYTLANGWEAQLQIDTLSGQVAPPRVALDDSGNVLALWAQDSGSAINLYAAERLAGNAWGAPGLVENNAAEAYDVRLAVTPAGQAIAVWGQAGDVYAAHHASGGGWTTPEVIDDEPTWATGDPDLALTDDGNAVVVWQQYDGTRHSIWSAFYQSGSWGTARKVEQDDSGAAQAPRVALHQNGDGIATFEREDGSPYSVETITLAASIWFSPKLLDEDNARDASHPAVAVDGSQNVVVVWQQLNSQGVYDIWARRFTSLGDFQEAKLVETNDTTSATEPRVAMSGSAVLVSWRQEVAPGGVHSAWVNVF